jgi:hypothetical protein
MSTPSAHLPQIVVPLQGWNQIRLGDTQSQVQAALQEAQLTYDNQYDPFCWDVDDATLTLTFEGTEPPRLAQIACGADNVEVYGVQLIGLPLHEALIALGVTSFDDTLWSIVDFDLEFSQGVAVLAEERSTQATELELLEAGTLWIKSLGLGLSLFQNSVDTVVLHAASAVPTVGCGPMTPELIQLSSDPLLSAKFEANRATSPAPTAVGLPNLVASLPPAFRGMLLVLGVLLMIAPPYVVYREYQRWSTGVEVQGEVIALLPEISPDVLRVRYPLPDGTVGEVEVSVNYVTARELGEQVALVYPEDNPRYALPRLQAREAFLSRYPALTLLAPFGVGLFLLIALWPAGPSSVTNIEEQPTS